MANKKNQYATKRFPDRDLYVIFHRGGFSDAAICNTIEDADRFIRNGEKKLGQIHFKYYFGAQAARNLPKGHKPREFKPRGPTKLDREYAFYASLVGRAA